MLGGHDFALVGLAALAAGFVNALAGGGTLFSFPMLTAIGVPAVSANVTNTVALCPGYLGATLAQAADLRGQARRLWWAMPVGAIGGVLGGLVLLATGDRAFRVLIPYLILLASSLLALQNVLRRWLVRRAARPGATHLPEGYAIAPVGAAAVYGGFFGAGLSVLLLAVLGLILDDSLTRLNALKQAIAFSVNVAAAVFFLFSGHVVWPAAAVMAVGALVGGAFGGRLARRISASALRRVVVVVGIVVAVIYWVH